MDLLSSQEVLNAIKQFSKTPQGRTAIKEQMKKQGQRKGDFVPVYWDKKSNMRNLKQVKNAAIDMANILYKHIVSDTITTGVDADGHSYRRVGLSEFNRSDIIAHRPQKVGADKYQCNISFAPGSLHRDSLIPDSEGLNNIISLFVTGYSDARNSVHGEWKGREIWTHRDREPNGAFLQNAVDEFNRTYKGKAVAIINESYFQSTRR